MRALARLLPLGYDRCHSSSGSSLDSPPANHSLRYRSGNRPRYGLFR